MKQLDSHAANALAGALRDIQSLANTNRREDLVHSIREAPDVHDFEVVPDNAVSTHLSRIAWACVQHRNAPAARHALHAAAQRLAGGQRAVAWLAFCNAVLDSGHPAFLKIRLLDLGDRLRTDGWGGSRSSDEPDPLGVFTRLVATGSGAQVRAYGQELDGREWPEDGPATLPGHPGHPGHPVHPSEPPPVRPRRWWQVAAGAAVLIAVVVWAVVRAGGGPEPVTVTVAWDPAVLAPGGAAVAVLTVPAGRDRLVLPLGLKDASPGTGICTATVDLAVDGAEPTERQLSEEVRTVLPKGHGSTVTVRLTLRTQQGCRYLVKTEKARFEG
ncbi:hypothetical protein ACFCX4_30480 [Kitasatospora sp. NPDC056327]|uniref:hypothetical protein n=1 Tax=Kitasatospora sp. NPDC056327 TaxID=3345785 RepID=UPI0035D63B78